MKKLLTLIMIMLLAVPAISLADLPDISGLSAAELLELNHQIQNKLFSEQLTNGVAVPTGTYIIGEDIPAGSYRVILTATLDYVGGTLIEGRSGWDAEFSVATPSGQSIEIGKLVLEEGLNLYIDQAVAVFYPYTGLFFKEATNELPEVP